MPRMSSRSSSSALVTSLTSESSSTASSPESEQAGFGAERRSARQADSY
jgi:hypothetical protein